MSRQRCELVTATLQNKMYDVITEYASVDYPEKGSLIVSEYCGKSVRAWKDDKGNTRVMCPKNMDTVQEGHVANAIANGTIFDDADEVSRNAEMVEKLSLPINGMVNRGMDTPKHVRPMIAIVIGRMGDDGAFDPEGGRINGVNFLKDLCCKDKDINDVCDNYLEKDPDEYYGHELGHEIHDMKPEVEKIRDVDYEDTISDDDVVDSYDGYDMDEIEGKEAPAEVDPEAEETEEPEETEDKLVDEPESEDDESSEDENEDGEDEVEECGDLNNTPPIQESANARCRAQFKNDSYFNKYIEEQTKRIEKFKDTHVDGKAESSRVVTLSNLYKDLIYAKYSYGCSISDIKSTVKEYLELLAANTTSISSYNDMIDILSFIIVFRPDVKETPILNYSKYDDALVLSLKSYIKKNTINVDGDKKLTHPKEYKPFYDYLTDVIDEDEFKKFMDKEWYDSCTNCSWYNSHKRETDTYVGYWCWLAAAICKIKKNGIDNQYVPKISSSNKTVQESAIRNDEGVYEEGFLSKKPKKLKPIGRDVVAYITVEMNAIHSSNDQAMLAGYTCSKIELVDFYLTCIDTQDARYIVPHNKQYLEQMKKDLENLLAQILRIRPINRTEQIWRVNYPTT